MGLARNQYRVLDYLAGQHDPLAGIDVADGIEAMGRSSVYAALAALQRDAMVEAEWDHTDSHPRRMVRINPAGRAALQVEAALLTPGTRAYVEGSA